MQKPRDLTIILAAGKSSRIAQLSFDRPKTLLSVGGQSLLVRLCLMFASVSSKLIVVAGRNRDPIEAHLGHLALDIEVLGGDHLTNMGSAASLAAGLAQAHGSFCSCHILESDVILSESAFDRYISASNASRTITIPVRDWASDEKLFRIPGRTEFRIARRPPVQAEILGKFLGVTCLPAGAAAALTSRIPEYCTRSYSSFLPTSFPADFLPVTLAEGQAAEIDTGEDYRRVLLDPVLGKRVRHSAGLFRPPGQLCFSGPLKRLMGVHDPLGARMTVLNGFDGLWLGSFQIALASGGRDDASYDPSCSLELAERIQKAGNILPILVDAGNGFRDISGARAFVERAVAARVAGLCIEDNGTDRVCSLYNSENRDLVSLEAFRERIACIVGLAAGRLQIVARTEALVLERSWDEAAARLEGAASAGATALLPHYIGRDARIIRDFLKERPLSRPVLLIPTGLMDLPASEFKAMGCAAVVYANLDLRLRFKQLQEVYSRLSAEASLAKEMQSELADPIYMRETLEG